MDVKHHVYLLTTTNNLHNGRQTRTSGPQIPPVAPKPITTRNLWSSGLLNLQPKKVLSPPSPIRRWPLVVSPCRLADRWRVVGGDEDGSDDREEAAGHVDAEGPVVGDAVGGPCDVGGEEVAQRTEERKRC